MAEEKKMTMADLRKAAMDRVTAPIKELGKAIGEDVQALRESGFAKGVDKALETADKIAGPSGKAWLANGLDELRQAFYPGVQQIQAGNNPGLFGTITTGEATYERMGEFSIDDLRASASARKEASQEPQTKEKSQERNHEQERGER